MATSIFDNKATIPNEEMVATALADTNELWDRLQSHVKEHYQVTSRDWKFYSKKAGWTLRITGEKRNLIFFSPNDDYFLVTVNMSVKVSKIVLDLDISDTTKKLIKEAKPYAEGLSILIEVKKEEDLEDIKTILNIRDN